MNKSNAESLLGVNVSYSHLKALEYRLVYKIYSDKYPSGKLNDTTLKVFTYKVYSGKSSVQIFPAYLGTDSLKYNFKSKHQCFEYTYIDTVDLNDSKFDAIKNSGECKVYFGVFNPQRFQNMANISTYSYFTYAYVNTCLAPTNHSPRMDNFRAYFPCFAKAQLNYNYFDDSDHDSITYAFAQPNYDKDLSIPFETGFSTSNAFGAEFISLNNNGELTMVSNHCEKIYVYPLEIKEFRKISGKYIEISGLSHDFVLKIIPSLNNPPMLYGPYQYNAETGTQLCFTISSDDKNFIPPPPSFPDKPDSVKLQCNLGFQGATYALVDSLARCPKLKFCWTPQSGQQSTVPYTFTITATDNNWLSTYSTSRTYSIQVRQKVNSISSLGHPTFSIVPNPSVDQELAIEGVAMDQIQILNTEGQCLMDRVVPPTSLFKTNVDHLKSGLYVVLVRANGIVYHLKWVKK